MKTKIIGILIAFIMIFSTTMVMSGCMTSALAKYIDSGHWVIDFNNSSPVCADIFDNFTIDVNRDSIYIYIDNTDDAELSSNSLQSGTYALEYGSIFYASSTNVLWTVLNEKKDLSIATLEGMEDKFYLRNLEINYTQYRKVDYISFTKTEQPAKPEESHFVEIKTAYANAGYSVDINLGEIDPTLKPTIEAIEKIYATLGYKFSYIGKNLSSIMSMEFYILIEASDADAANEIAETYKGIYPYAKNGKDIIIYLSVFESANFTPFEQACN